MSCFASRASNLDTPTVARPSDGYAGRNRRSAHLDKLLYLSWIERLPSKPAGLSAVLTGTAPVAQLDRGLPSKPAGLNAVLTCAPTGRNRANVDHFSAERGDEEPLVTPQTRSSCLSGGGRVGRSWRRTRSSGHGPSRKSPTSREKSCTCGHSPAPSAATATFSATTSPEAPASRCIDGPRPGVPADAS